MRLAYFLVAAALTAACTFGSRNETDVTSPPPPPTATPACLPDPSTACDGALARALGEPTHVGTLLWAQRGTHYDAPAGTELVPQIAVYEDGTVRRTPVLRSLDYLARPPKGLIVAALSAAALARVRSDVDAVPPEAAVAWHHTLLGSEATILDVRDRRACFTSLTSCVPPPLATASATVTALLAATEAKWRDARAGTVSLGEAITIAGDWPLDEAIASDGTHAIPQEDYAKISTKGAYRLAGGDYVWVSYASNNATGARDVYLTRRSVYVMDDAALRAELFANQGRYESSKGEWLGLELGEDRFPAAKNRELASAPGDSHVYWFRAIEHMDLRGDGPIDP